MGRSTDDERAVLLSVIQVMWLAEAASAGHRLLPKGHLRRDGLKVKLGGEKSGNADVSVQSVKPRQKHRPPCFQTAV